MNDLLLIHRYVTSCIYLAEGLLLALFESNRKEEVLKLLETFDISKVTSDAVSKQIFKGLGKFLLESYAERYLLMLKGSGKYAMD